MTTFSLTRTTLLWGASLALSLVPVTPAQATPIPLDHTTATFAYSIDLSLNITDIEVDDVHGVTVPNGLSMSMPDFAFDSNSFKEGNATVSINSTTTPPSDRNHMGAGNILSFHVDSSGTASPSGYAESFYLMIGRMSLVNASDSDINVWFTNTFNYSGSASVTDPESEAAAAHVFLFFVRVDDTGFQVQGLVDEEDTAIAGFNSPIGGHTPAGGDIEFVNVRPHTNETLLVFMGGQGAAISNVPEPASVFLVGTGILAVGARRWRKRKTAE